MILASTNELKQTKFKISFASLVYKIQQSNDFTFSRGVLKVRNMENEY